MPMDRFFEKRAKALAETEKIREKSENPKLNREKEENPETRREKAENPETNREKAGQPLPRILVGAEVYYFPGIGKAEAIPKLCIEGTKTLLLEMPFEQWKEENLRDVRALITKMGLTIVLAHIERYVEFQRDRGIWDRILELPLYTQINTGSFLRRDGIFFKDKKKKFCRDWLRDHPDTLLGSDCHNMEDRRPNLAAGREEIAKTFGPEALERIDRITKKLLNLS